MQGSGSNAAVAFPNTLGKLTLLRQIGEGGMARIFLARSRGIGGFEKLVVVKQILPRLAEDAEFIARFFQEAQLAATLDHPNIASVYDVDEEGDAYFYSMEYVRGRDLQKVMRRAKQVGRPLALDEIIAIVSRLCAGLHHAHTHRGSDGKPLGIVHRDVSPSNVLISFEGAVKLADFGVAKARTGMVSTDAGTLRGKLGYMSPEQCRGHAVDRRSDVYAVGVLLWEMLTGRRLHHAESEVAIIYRIAHEPAPSPRATRPELTDELERIVARALACDPARRFPSAHALQAELEEHARQLRLATSARTIATLMHDLFEDETEEALPRARTSSTQSASGGQNTAPTVTVPPFPLQAEEAALPPSTDANGERGDRRSSWGGVGLGLGLGVLLGGGGLYAFASRSDDEASTAAEVPHVSRDVIEAAAVPPPVVSVTPASENEGSSAQSEAAETAEPKPVGKRTKRRKPRARRGSKPNGELNLDSPLPPRANR